MWRLGRGCEGISASRSSSCRSSACSGSRRSRCGRRSVSSDDHISATLSFPARSDMEPDEPIEYELLRNAVAAEVTVTNTEVISTSTGDRYVRIEGRLGDDEESHAEWAAIGFIYALGVLSFAAARPRGVSGIGFEEHDQCACTGPTQAFGLSL